MPEEHALLSASGAHRWLHCTPSARLEELLKEKSSEYAEEGRLAHSLGEIKLRKHFTPLKPSEYKKQMKEIQDNPLYASEMNSYTDEYLELVKDYAAGYASKPYVAIEQRLDYSHIAPDGFGTGDCVMIGGNCLIVIDFKYGQGVPVSAEENPQMKLYALGALSVFSLLYNVEYIKLVVFQPRINNTSEWGVSRAELEAWGESIKPVAQTAHAGKGEYCAGEHCRFCRAKSLCRTRSVFSQEAFDQYNGMKPPLISPGEVGEILKRADVIKKWITDLEDWTLSELLDNRPVPGWKAVEGRSNRQFADTDLAFGAVKSAGYDEAVLYERKPITLTAVEKLLGKAKFEEVLTPHIIKPPGKPTLAPETDKREAISNKVTAAEAFGKEQ